MARFLYAFLVLLCPIVVSAQASLIRGTVLEQTSGTPLPGATVTLKGTNTGTTTDEKGQFAIRAHA